MPWNDTDHALVIGIDDYPKFRPLRGAIRDAKRFTRWLGEEDGGGVRGPHCHTVFSSSDPVRPVQDEIDEHLCAILADVEANRGRRLTIFFSGHGMASEHIGAHLCLATWSKVWRNAALDSDSYLNTLLAYGRFSEVVMYLDCCRVREVSIKGKDPNFGPAKPEDTPGGGAAETCYYLGYATAFLRPSFEAATGATPDATDEIRGHFTRALIAGLRGGAADEQGRVTPGSLKMYLEVETPRIAAKKGHIQKPEVINGLPTNPEPVFAQIVPQINVRIRFSAQRSGLIRLEDGNLDLVREDDASIGPWELTLARGRHVLLEVDTGETLEIPFRPSTEVQDVSF